MSDSIEHGGLDSHADREVEKHIHSYESWLEAAASASGEVHVADELAIGLAFTADAGDNTWGTWLQILGSTDTPMLSSMVKYDLHRILISENEVNNQVYIIQIGFGDSGAIALAANDVTTFPIRTGAGVSPIPPAEFQNKRQSVGTKAWLRLRAPGSTNGELDFFIGIHEYDF